MDTHTPRKPSKAPTNALAETVKGYLKTLGVVLLILLGMLLLSNADKLV